MTITTRNFNAISPSSLKLSDRLRLQNAQLQARRRHGMPIDAESAKMLPILLEATRTIRDEAESDLLEIDEKLSSEVRELAVEVLHLLRFVQRDRSEFRYSEMNRLIELTERFAGRKRGGQ